MMVYAFYLKGDFYMIFATTYEGACRAFLAMTSKAALDAAIVTSVKKAA